MRILAAIVALCAYLFIRTDDRHRRIGDPRRASPRAIFVAGMVFLVSFATAAFAHARPSPYPPVTQFVGDRYGSAQLGPEVARSVRCPPPCARSAGKARYLYPTRKRPPVSRKRQRWQQVPIFAPLAYEPYRVEAPISIGEGARREVAQVIGGRPAGCPHAFCGCGASLHLFGRIIPALNLAANWLRFPRAAPGPDMVAARRGHVFVLKRHIAGNTWLVHDSNSGRGRTRLHPRSIAGYVIVNPRSNS